MSDFLTLIRTLISNAEVRMSEHGYLQKDRDGRPIHVLWGIPKGFEKPAHTALPPGSDDIQMNQHLASGSYG